MRDELIAVQCRCLAPLYWVKLRDDGTVNSDLYWLTCAHSV